MIKSFSNTLTEKIFLGEELNKKERKAIGSLKLDKAAVRLAELDKANEKTLLLAASLHYHNLSGTERYSIDADSRRSKWRITFRWENDLKTDLELVQIEDTH